jgi:hypothetical protein
MQRITKATTQLHRKHNRWTSEHVYDARVTRQQCTESERVRDIEKSRATTTKFAFGACYCLMACSLLLLLLLLAFLLFLGFSCRRTMQRLLLSYCVWHGYIDTAQLILNHMKADGCDDGDQGELHDIKLPTAEQQQERLGMWHLAGTTHYIASHRIASHHHCTWSTCLL